MDDKPPEFVSVMVRFSGEDEQDVYFAAPKESIEVLVAVAEQLQGTPTKGSGPGVGMWVFIEWNTGDENHED